MNTNNKFNTHRLTFSAVMLALAMVLALVCDLIPFLHMTYGGGFTIASMLPIIVVSYVYGVKWGLFTSLTYSGIQIIMDLFRGRSSVILAYFLPEDEGGMQIFAAIAITLIDYVIAYGILGIGGAFRKNKNKTLALSLGSLLAVGARYVAHIVSGFIFWGSYAKLFFTEGFYPELGEKILGAFDGKALALVYSVIYNGLYMIPEIIVTTIAAVIISRLPQIKARQL